MPLRRGKVRSRSARGDRSPRLQLFDLQQERFSSSHRAEISLHSPPGSESLSTYTFNTGVAKHLFCKRCGVKSFYIPRSNPDGYSVNVRCLEPATIRKIVVIPFDGKNWEEHAAELAPLSTKG